MMIWMPRTLQEMKKKKQNCKGVSSQAIYCRLAIHLSSLLLGASVDMEHDSRNIGLQKQLRVSNLPLNR